MIKLEDGRGSGRAAGVSSKNRLMTSSVVRSAMAHNAEEDATAYLTYLKRNVSAADTYQALGYLTYLGTQSFLVHKILLTATENASFEVFMNPTSISGGDDRIPFNTNLRSGKTLLATCKTGTTAITGTTADENEIACARVQAYSTMEWVLDGALILPKNATIWVQGKSPTNGAQLRAILFGYEKAV